MDKSLPRRWLVITSSFPRHDTDLAGHFVSEWCQSLTKRGHTIDVLAWRGSGSRDRQLTPNLNVRFVPYAWPTAERLFYGAGAPENLTQTPLTALLAMPAAMAMIAAALKACQQNQYDAVIGHWLVPGGLIARWIGALTGLKSYVIGHSGGVHLLANLPSALGQAIARQITNGPTSVPTTPLQKKLRNLSDNRDQQIDIAPMGYTELKPSSGSSRDTSDPTFRLGFLGRLVPIKGLPTIFRALDRLHEDGLPLELEVIGDGPCREKWESNSSPNIHFRGARFGAQKWAALQTWDALILPSQPRDDGRHEGLPVSLLEAASVGTIPLVSGVPGVHKWLARPAQQIIENGDISNWCRSIQWLIDLPRHGRESVVEETRQKVCSLAWPTYAQDWERWLTANAQDQRYS